MKHALASACAGIDRCGTPVPAPQAAGVVSADAPLAGLAGSTLSGRFRHWRGAKGRRYLFSVFPLHVPGAMDDLPRFHDAVVLAVARRDDGERTVLALDDIGALPDLFYVSAAFRDAVARGANEIHIHLLTEDAAERVAMLRDLEAA